MWLFLAANFLESRQHEVRHGPSSTLHSNLLLEPNVAARGILNCTNTGDFGGDGLHVAQRFELFLDKYRRPDGSRWTGQQIDEATGGIVTRSYVTNLRKGRIENPGYEKMRMMAKAMGFAPEAWFEDISAEGSLSARKEGRALPGGSSTSSGR
jgi:transcriptional regulator with XRE-family HTH domain